MVNDYLGQSQCCCHSPGCCQTQCNGWGPGHERRVIPCWPRCLERSWPLHHQCHYQCYRCCSPGCCQSQCSGWGPDHLQHETPCWPQCLGCSWLPHHQCCRCCNPGCCQIQCSGWGPGHERRVIPCWPQCLERSWPLHRRCCGQCWMMSSLSQRQNLSCRDDGAGPLSQPDQQLLNSSSYQSAGSQCNVHGLKQLETCLRQRWSMSFVTHTVSQPALCSVSISNDSLPSPNISSLRNQNTQPRPICAATDLYSHEQNGQATLPCKM